MQTTITFKKIDSSDSLKSYVHKKLARFDKMLESPGEAHVVLSIEKIRHIAEITLTCDRLKINAREKSESMYSSIDALMDKVSIQLKKNREKIRRHMSGKKQSIKNGAAESQFSENISEPPANSHDSMVDNIIVEPIDYKPMDIEDAVIELDSGRQSFFVFNNARTEQLNVLYKHNNGKLGLIQPRG